MSNLFMALNSRKGFILYIVMAVLLALAILAFALNTFKQGTVTQLARSVDQNRLALLAQSANAEVVAMIRSQVNIDKSSQIFAKFRSIFPTGGTPGAALNSDIVLFSNFEPQQTLQIAKTAGYPLKIKSKAVLRVYRQAEFSSVSAYNAYIDVYSQAYREGVEENLIEAYERRDVRLVDLRHNLDKYALFVKNYSPDYNNTARRIIIQGITPSGPNISRVYLGNDNYPDGHDEQKDLWLDLCFEEHKDAPGFSQIFNFSGLKKFPGGAGSTSLFSFSETQFSSLKGITIEQFYHVRATMRVYENFVNEAANGCFGKVEPYKIGSELKVKCQNAMTKSNSNAASFQICDDFAKNAAGLDYSKCSGFQKILKTCITEWKYHHGYVDAAGVWDVDSVERPNLPNPKQWSTALAYKGLTELSEDYGKKGPYFYGYLDQTADKAADTTKKVYNPERIRVGKMLKLYGYDNDTPVLVEGPVYLRFFKVAYLDEFTKQIEFFSGMKAVNPEPVPLMFMRPKLEPKAFLNTVLGNDLAASPYFSDNLMMSRAVDDLSINALLGNSVTYYDGERKQVTINPLTAARPTFVYPAQKPSASAVSARAFGRLIDFKTVSRNYPSPAEFLQDRVNGSGAGKVLSLDGVMYIESGDLDLSDINEFYGKGMIYLGRGNCLIGDLTRQRDPVKTGDSLRIYLRQGDFIIQSSKTEITIEASLAAFYNPPGSSDPKNQGSLILNRKARVLIRGNLLVDYLYTQDTSDSGLAKNGVLIVEHDPLLYEPAAEVDKIQLDPYHVSIGPVRTSFALNAGGKTF